MALDPAISLSYQPTQAAVNPFGLALQASQMRAQQQEIQQRDLAMQQARRQQADDEQYRQAIQASAGLTPDELLAHVQSTAPGHYPAVQKALDESREKASQAKSAAATAASAQAQAALHQQNYISHLVNSVDQADYNPVVFNAALNDAVQAFPEWKGHADELRSIAATQGKDALKSALQPFMGADVRKTNAETANTTAELPGKVAQSAVQQQVAAGTVGGLTPEQQQQSKDRAATNQIAAGNLGVARAREQRETAQAKITANDVTDLSPAGLDAAATMFAKSGQLPALGNGDKNTRKKIINRAAELMPGLDVASAKADYHANTQSLSNIGGTLDTLESFSNAARKNLTQFVGLAQKLPDTGVPWANTPLRLLNDKMVGAEYMPAITAARAVALREVARITGDPKLKGVLSDAARTEVDNLVPKDITLAQLKRVIPVLLADMDNVHSTLSDQKKAIQDRIKLAGPQIGTADTGTQPKRIRYDINGNPLKD